MDGARGVRGSSSFNMALVKRMTEAQRNQDGSPEMKQKISAIKKAEEQQKAVLNLIQKSLGVGQNVDRLA